jgi:signal transduction histidine kinase
MIGVIFDITERKEAERERLELTGRVITAQEQERRRIAREVHDDFCQRLAVSTMKLRSLAAMTSGSESLAVIDDLIGGLTELGGDMQGLSHRLHPAKLDVLDLVQSIDGLCREMASEYGLEITFTPGSVPHQVVDDLKLAAFRIVQEALHNTVKYSGASRAEVRLTADNDAITVAVSDDGKGFDPADCVPSDGIGFQSMKERALTLGGHVRIETRPRVEGVLVVATLPWGQEHLQEERR